MRGGWVHRAGGRPLGGCLGCRLRAGRDRLGRRFQGRAPPLRLARRQGANRRPCRRAARRGRCPSGIALGGDRALPHALLLSDRPRGRRGIRRKASQTAPQRPAVTRSSRGDRDGADRGRRPAREHSSRVRVYLVRRRLVLLAPAGPRSHGPPLGVSPAPASGTLTGRVLHRFAFSSSRRNALRPSRPRQKPSSAPATTSDGQWSPT